MFLLKEGGSRHHYFKHWRERDRDRKRYRERQRERKVTLPYSGLFIFPLTLYPPVM